MFFVVYQACGSYFGVPVCDFPSQAEAEAWIAAEGESGLEYSVEQEAEEPDYWAV